MARACLKEVRRGLLQLRSELARHRRASRQLSNHLEEHADWSHEKAEDPPRDRRHVPGRHASQEAVALGDPVGQEPADKADSEVEREVTTRDVAGEE